MVTEPARPGTASQEVVASSIPSVLAGVEYLSEYSHGCLDQKMSKRPKGR